VQFTALRRLDPLRDNADMTHPHGAPPELILASSSVYRRELLARLGLPFRVVAPEVDETPELAEAPAALAARLATAKAQAVAILHPQAVVLGSDQVADLDGSPLGKPGDHARARQQLRLMSGRAVLFHTAVCVIRGDTGWARTETVSVKVTFRILTDAEIDNYLAREQPYDCAGSAKCEGLGIALLAAIDSDDPTTLIGLPLIRTCTLLRQVGIDPLGSASLGAPSLARA